MKTATRIRNVAFCLVCLAVFCAAILYKAADLAGALPEQLDNGSQSYLEGAALQPLPEASLAAFASGDLQDEIEDYLSGCWPARDEALLANAALQRAVIRAANIPWGFEAYHTFYGSSHCYIPAYDAVAPDMKYASSSRISSMSSAAAQYGDFASSHPQYRVFFYLPDEMSITPSSPLASLQANAATWETYSEFFLSNLGESVTAVSAPEESLSDYFATHFRTDHHWNMAGAYEGYCEIAEALGEEPLEASDPQESTVPMYGSYARSGMLLPDEPDHIMDYRYDFDFSNYSVTVSSKHGDSQLLTRSELLDDTSEWQSEKLSDRYGEYHPYIGCLTEIDNNAQGNGKGLLIVGDSYARAIDRLLAAHYSRTYYFDPRDAGDMTIDDLLSSYDVDDIVFVETVEAIARKDFLGSLQ